MRYDIGSVCRPALGEHVSGDGFSVLHDEATLLVTVVDGLGHGEGAAEASTAFLEFVEQNADAALDDLMTRASKHLIGTRGAAASLIRIDPTMMKLHSCCVGNVHFHSLADRSIHPVAAPGIVGHRIRKVLHFSFDLPETGLFALCSDGLSSRIHLEQHANGSAQAIADELLEHHGKFHDDATCVVVRYEVD